MAELVKYTKVTNELLDILKIHTTPSSLRRDCAYAQDIIEQFATNTMPRIFYVLDQDHWEYHACEVDWIAFLWKQNLNEDGNIPIDPIEPDKPKLTHSKLFWDGVLGGPYVTASIIKGHEGHVPPAIECLYITGEIEHDVNLNGNYIGFELYPDAEMLKYYAQPNLIAEDERIIINGFNDGKFSGIVKITEPGQSVYMKLNWTGINDVNFNPEEFGIEISPETILNQ